MVSKSSVHSKCIAMRDLNDLFKDFLVMNSLLSCVSTGDLVKIDSKMSMMDNLERFSISEWSTVFGCPIHICIDAQCRLPFKHSNSSVGAIYLAVMNLPYQVRFKRENIIVLGIIPGPREPKTDINQYLLPFVKELQKFETGVLMDVHGCCTKQKVRCMGCGL